ncbi:MAG: hypothetical protein R3E88_02205 [Myxococcota bacterium]
MRRVALALVGVALLLGVLALAHMAWIESAGEVAVVRTVGDDGSELVRRLWIVDDAQGVAWLHGADSQWMRNLRARPEVVVERGGVARRYRAVPVPGPHPAIHELLRAKYGLADAWVRTIGRDDERAMPVRLDPVEAPAAAD